MNNIAFSIEIHAPKEKVWEALWKEENYRHWTSAFAEGSHAQTDWQEGSKVLFLDGNGNGMFSIIEKNIPNMQMTFKHLGEIKNGVETTSDWGGAIEDYQLSQVGEYTLLQVGLDMTEAFEQYFKETFPKALHIVKQIAESK